MGAMMPVQQGKSARATRAMMPAQCRQQQQQHNAGNDASAMQAKRQRNTGKCQHCTSQTFEGQLGDNADNRDSLTLVMMPVQCGQGHQRNTKKTQLLPRLDC
jgi:hypothetical protein